MNLVIAFAICVGCNPFSWNWDLMDRLCAPELVAEQEKGQPEPGFVSNDYKWSGFGWGIGDPDYIKPYHQLKWKPFVVTNIQFLRVTNIFSTNLTVETVGTK